MRIGLNTGAICDRAPTTENPWRKHQNNIEMEGLVASYMGYWTCITHEIAAGSAGKQSLAPQLTAIPIHRKTTIFLRCRKHNNNGLAMRLWIQKGQFDDTLTCKIC